MLHAVTHSHQEKCHMTINGLKQVSRKQQQQILSDLGRLSLLGGTLVDITTIGLVD